MSSIRFLSSKEIDTYLQNLKDEHFEKAVQDCFPELINEEKSHKSESRKEEIEKKPGRVVERIFKLESNSLSRYTTAGFYRVYCLFYLRQHNLIRNDLTLMVRLLQPGAKGLGMEIYCFTDTADWSFYESIQAEVIENLIAAAEVFSLNIFQDVTGRDFSMGLNPNSLQSVKKVDDKQISR